jgi:hypothetical protein
MSLRKVSYLAAVTLTLVLAPGAHAGNVIRFTNATVAPGDTFSVDVILENTSVIGGFVIPFRWSTSDVQFTGSEFVTERFLGQYVTFNRTVDPELRIGGIIFISGSDSTDTVAAILPGTGSVARLHFRASRSALDGYAFVDSANAYDQDGTAIAFASLSDLRKTNLQFVTAPGVIRIGNPTPMGLELSPTSLSFHASIDNTLPPTQRLDVSSQGAEDMLWSASSASTWLSLSPPLGKTPARIRITADAFGLGIGVYYDTIRFSSPQALTEPLPVPVLLVVDTASGPPPPSGFALYQCRPSPFVIYHDPQTEIPFNLVDADHVTLMMYDALGRRVRTLVSQSYSAGDHSVLWDGRDEQGNAVASGRYFYRMTTSHGSQTRPLIVIK